MSRQKDSKSRGEKGASRGGGGAQSVSIPAVSNDIIPGRMTVADWNKISGVEDDDEFVSQIVEEILDITMDKCYDKYVWKQVLPYTVFKAKDDLLDIIEWRFLSHDVGELDVKVNHGWAEDNEPEPGIIDSWAQGSVPIIFTKSPEFEMPPLLEEILEKPDEEVRTLDDTGTETISLGTGLSTHETEKETKPVIEEKEKEVEKPVEKPVKKKFTYKKHVGRLPSAHLGEMERTLDQSESDLFARELSDLDLPKEPGAHLSPSQKSLLKLQAGRPPGNKEVTFDEKGNVVAVMRLDTKSLPTHKVRVNYSIIDPEAEAAAQRLEAMRTGKLRSLAKIQWKPRARRTRLSPSRVPMEEKQTVEEQPKNLLPAPPSPRRNIPTGKTRMTAQSTQRSFAHSRHQPAFRRKDEDPNVEPLPPSLIESIDASPGVVITEGDQTKKGAESRTLGPLRQAPVLRDDGTIIGNVMITTKGGRTLRLLGAASGPPSSSGKSDIGIRPLLSPSHVLSRHTPHVTSPFSVTQPIPPLSSNSVTSS
uniref:uncharacterized protein C2orf81 homolog n=1 Tax=Styela clava TaxID=7725 RepID=UPI001939347F|nr:uncharacterized protein C2orf81 homolog [Styela clava]